MSEPISTGGASLPASQPHGWMEATVKSAYNGSDRSISFRRSADPAAVVEVTIRVPNSQKLLVINVQPAALFAAIELIKQKGE